ncbi:hypothetical protein HQ560_20105 [bacterium]|nr:hypothetical protein [bacterium]
METDFAHTSLFGSGWKAPVVEEVDKAAAPQVNALLTTLETVPRRRIGVLTTNMDPTTLAKGKDGKWSGGIFAGRRDTIPGETEKALVGRCYVVRFSTEGLATRKGEIGPGPLRVMHVAEAFGINGKPQEFHAKHFRKCGGSIREAINTLLTV